MKQPISRRIKLERLTKQIANIVEECQRDVENAELERDKAVAEVNSRIIDKDLSGEDITPERLSEFLDYVGNGHERWTAKYGRLTFWCRIDGSWGLAFNATYGGNIGSYRKLKTITEVKTLVELLGVMTFEKLKQR